ncbi:MAG: anion permease [Chloroflexi bacterium]|nr:anion permease [Chloroflexota bacterium]
MFRGLDRIALAKLAGHIEPVRVHDGEALFFQGDPGDALYLISRGAYGVYARSSESSDEVLLQRLHRGEAIGEIALLTDEPRSSTIRGEGDGEVLRLPKARFLDLVRSDPSVGLAISATLIRRLRAADAARLGTPPPALDTGSLEAERDGPARLNPRWTDGSGRSRPNKRAVGLGLSALLFVGGWFGVAPPPGLGEAGWHALVSLVAIVPALVLEAMPDGALALLLVSIWAAGGVVPTNVALGGFSTTTFVLVVAVFTVGAAIASSGLLYRLALWSASRTASFAGQVLTLGVSGAVLGPAVPNATGRMALAASAVGELADALGYEPGSSTASGLAMAALAGYGQMVALVPTSSSVALLALALLPDTARADVTWIGWGVRALPLHLVVLGGLLATTLWISRPWQSGRSKDRMVKALTLQRALLGRLSRSEAVAAVTTLALLVGFATQPVHGVDPAWLCIGAMVVLAACGVLTVDTLRTVNWSTVLLLGMLAGLGSVFTATGLDAWLGSVVVASVGGLASLPVVFVLGLAVACIGLSFALRWQAAVPIVVVAMSPVARAAAIDPWIVAIVTLTASNTFFLPYQSTIYLALYDGAGARQGLFRHAQFRPLSVAYALLVLGGLAISVPFWHSLGLL